MNTFRIIKCLFLISLCVACSKPADINRYNSVINAYANSGDSLKLKAARYIISNIDLHYSDNYYWQDTLGNKLPFSEFDYDTFVNAIRALKQLADTVPLNAHPYTVADAKLISADALQQYINCAFEAWQSGPLRNASYQLFEEYILPYRVRTEVATQWHNTYKTFFNTSEKTDVVKVASEVNHTIAANFINTHCVVQRKEPLPFLSASQLMFRRQGHCFDMANLAVYALRSQGIAAAVDFVPYWGTTSNRHFWACAIDSAGTSYPFEVGELPFAPPVLARHGIAKVKRVMYGCQPECLANSWPLDSIKDKELQYYNLKDVTHLYATSYNVVFNPGANHNNAVAYLCVFNSNEWKPVEAAKVTSGHLEYSNMGAGIVYLPMLNTGNAQSAIDYPVLLSPQGNQVRLSPQYKQTISIKIPNKPQYLNLKPGKYYTLYYWDKGWLKGGRQQASEAAALFFNNLPSGCLYRLVADYSSGNERPFIVNNAIIEYY